MSNINFGRGYVYSIQYHIVWCVKYRRKVLIDNIEKTLKELLIEISNENNIKIIDKLWNGHLWNPSYFVATVSENTEEQIKRYIQTQKER